VYVDAVEPGKTRALLSIVKPGHVVFDIGANIGYYTVLASQQVGPTGRVVAFEPLARNVSYLYRHVRLNRAENVRLIPLGCSDRTGVALFRRGPDYATGSLTRGPRSSSALDELVGVTTVDDVVQELGLVPNVLKIDVEGAEERVLKGAARTLDAAHPAVLVGVHSEPLRAACTSFLRALGYGEPVVCEEVEGDAELLFLPLAATREGIPATSNG
jgi:FkbM family methyltransferase